MKAIVIREHGGLDKLRLEEIPAPEISEREVLVRVKACALNHLDIWVRRGIPGLNPPHTPGADVAGVVERIGAAVKDIKAGERVVLNPNLNCGECEYCQMGEDSLCIKYGILGEHAPGGYAEFVKIPARNVIRIPDHVSFDEAAAVPLVFMTAWRMVVTRAQVRPGEDLLVLAAGSGVGSAAIQIAKLCGARVIATASTDEKLAKARELGADIVINYAKTDSDKEVWKLTNRRGVDVVIESVGQATWPKSLRALARNGRLVTCGATTGPLGETDIRLIFWKQLQILGSTMGTRSELLDALKLVWAGKLRPVIAGAFPLAEAAKAQEMLEKREQFGKLLLHP
ncbi:zinc-binding dehydrogenase [Candidatus Acetothermia bacterium]|jgi:NADPH:quinone reductase-like Zn-dependent oxidoreductase|nr:zinc-binding dehydrogenase [Candidatus Acetothermia bacterium]MCI2432571.1 zinc-binding dehydrogenase [Candidatus Acetothermia bacterium]MCI2436421.1 zinc-binding dehydrogenase [Candidatus Acetothermia bacterium]